MTTKKKYSVICPNCGFENRITENRFLSPFNILCRHCNTRFNNHIATYHFRLQLSTRLKIADCPKDVQKEIVNRIENRIFANSVRDKKGNYVYDLYTEGLLKSMLPTLPDKIKVVYNWSNNKLITVMEA